MKSKVSLLALALVFVTAAATPHGIAPVLGSGSLFHFGLSGSTPAADASVSSPEELRLWFTQVPQDNSVSVRLIDAAGDLVEAGDPTYDTEDRKIIHVAVDGTLAAGTYTVAWRGIGDDGHVVRGDYAFSVTAQ